MCLKVNKKFLIRSLSLLVVGLFPLCLFAEILFGEGYFNSLHQSLNQAQKSITVAMYFIILEPGGNGPVTTIVDDLIAAQSRGVKVKVVLEDSKAQECRAAFEKLKASGVDVAFDTPAHLLHLKGIVVDSRYLFVGSANLSRAAIESNYEATAFYDAPQDAAALESYVASIPLNKGDIVFPAQEGVAIPADFLLSAQGGRILIANEADSQFDLYLLLCRIGANNHSPVVVDYDSLAKELGFLLPSPLGKYRSAHDYYYERVHRALVKLQHNGLIDYKNGVVTLRLTPPNPLFTKEGERSDALAFVKRGPAKPGRVRSRRESWVLLYPPRLLAKRFAGQTFDPRQIYLFNFAL